MAAVNGNARTTGCTTAGKRVAEKNTPDNIHIGSMTRFMSPEAASMDLAREDTNSPKAENANEASTHRNPNCHIDPRNGTPNTSRANPRNAATSITSSASRDSRYDARYCQRRIGEATRRLSNFFCLASTIENPIPQIAEPRSEEHTSELQSLR